MSGINQQIRALAERVAASHGLEVVDLEFLGGGGKHRTLRIFLERNAAGRAALEERLQVLRRDHEEEPEPPEEENEEARDTETEDDDGSIVLDLVDAGEAAGLSPEEDELAYLRELPDGIPVGQLSGITHGDCERFSRDFGTALDVEDLVPGAEYLLEASSPGLDRKLAKPEEFARFAGRLCKVQLFTPVDGNRHWQGHIVRADETSMTLAPVVAKQAKKKTKEAAKEVELPLSNVEKAQLVPEF